MLGLVVEGGANRTYYSVGVLDALIEEGIWADALVGVSAGIANGVSYVSGQKGRSIEIGLKFVPDKRYMGFSHFFKKGNGSYYNRGFVFDRIPNSIVPFDYEAFANSPCTSYAVITNIATGKPEYKKVEPDDKSWTLIQASCALPFMFRPVKIDDAFYFDGGCTDPLPVRFAYEIGCDKVITILTREESYEKQSETDVKLSTFFYRKHKAFSDAMKKRSAVYNESRKYIYNKQKQGTAFIFAPRDTGGWKRTEKDPVKIKAMYDEGYNDAKAKMDELKAFINS